MTEQALIVAGGYGMRMSPELNPHQSKHLIEYAGQSMLGHLIDGLRQGGITRYLVASGTHNHDMIKEVVDGKNVDSMVVPVGGGFRRVPHFLDDLLDEQFMMVCGHQPLPADFVRQMLHASASCDYVLAAYDNAKYPLNKEKRILFDGNSNEIHLRTVDLHTDGVEQEHKYVRNPYIVRKEIIKLCRDDAFRWSFSHYIFVHWSEGVSLAVVEAVMPPEFDDVKEFEKTKFFLDRKGV